MLISLKNVFNPSAVAKSFETLEPLKSTAMDTFFPARINHQSPMLGYSEVERILRSVPVVRRDGAPVNIGGDNYSMDYFAPYPIKVSINVSASELNDVSALMNNAEAVAAWRTKKIDELRRATRITTEGMASVVLTTGKLAWGVDIKGGRSESFEIDFGAIPTFDSTKKITEDTTVSALYRILKDMETGINMRGYGGKVKFYVGKEVFATLLDICDAPLSQTKQSSMKISLEQGKVIVGGYEMIAFDETYPTPEGDWVPKLGAKSVLAVASEIQGSVYYCALDSVSANNQALPMHIITKVNDDDSGVTIIAQSKPVPLRPSKASCLWQAVA